MKISACIKEIAVLIVTMLLVACDGNNMSAEPSAAPLGERAVLESLAASFTAISDEKLSVSPMSMSGEDRKEFVAQVFARSGYSYSMTLTNMAEAGIDTRNSLHIDMAELVLMPHRSPRYPVELTDLYTSEELQAIAVIERQLNM